MSSPHRTLLTLVSCAGLLATGSCLTAAPNDAARAAEGSADSDRERVVSADAEASAREQPRTWHATAYVRGRMGIRVIDYWSAGAKMRARTLIAGHPITTIVRGEHYLAFDRLTGRGVRIRRAPEAVARDAERLRPFAFELDELVRDGGEKVEDVELGSTGGEVWRVTDASGRRQVWVSKGIPRVPFRVETFNRASGESIDLDYANWTFDLELPDGFFSPPVDLVVETFEYGDYVAKAARGEVPPIPVLYPDLLHGQAAR